MRQLYNTNKDFHAYVDRYCKNHNEGRSITVEEALKHKLVQEYGKMCQEEREESEECDLKEI